MKVASVAILLLATIAVDSQVTNDGNTDQVVGDASTDEVVYCDECEEDGHPANTLDAFGCPYGIDGDACRAASGFGSGGGQNQTLGGGTGGTGGIGGTADSSTSGTADSSTSGTTDNNTSGSSGAGGTGGNGGGPGGPGEVVGPGGTNPNSGDLPMPGGQTKATEVQAMISEVSELGVSASVVTFELSVGGKIQQYSAIVQRMVDRQVEMDDLFFRVLPSLEQALDSRNRRAVELRAQIGVMNDKLYSVMDSLDHSSYVQEQRTYMNIISTLTQLQNLVDSSTGTSPSTTAQTRLAVQHPGQEGGVFHSLVSIDQHAIDQHAIDQHAIPAAATVVAKPETATPKVATAVETGRLEESNMQDLMDALDLLEIETSTVSRIGMNAPRVSLSQQATSVDGTPLSYERRMVLLGRRINILLNRLTEIFGELRDHHREFASANRDMWSHEIDVLQQHTEYLAYNMESVIEQAHFYLLSYNTQRNHLVDLSHVQTMTLERARVLRGDIAAAGTSFHTLSQIRASQLHKLQEVLHYLVETGPYAPDVFDFACDGIVGGSGKVDVCGVCGGNNMTCEDCAGVAHGNAELDVCGVCGGGGLSCSYFCDGLPNSGKITDLCGQCGGDGDMCVGCDGLPNSGVAMDDCGVCGGGGLSCDGNRDGIRETMTPRPSLTEDVVAIKIKITNGPAPGFTGWTPQDGARLRDAVASITGISSSNVALLDVEPFDEYVIAHIGVITTKLETEAARVSIQQAGTAGGAAGGLLDAVHIAGIAAPLVEITEGPAINQAPVIPSTLPTVNSTIPSVLTGNTNGLPPAVGGNTTVPDTTGPGGCCVGPYTVTASGDTIVRSGLSYPTGYEDGVQESACVMTTVTSGTESTFPPQPSVDAGGAKSWRAGACVDAVNEFEPIGVHEGSTSGDITLHL